MTLQRQLLFVTLLLRGLHGGVQLLEPRDLLTRLFALRADGGQLGVQCRRLVAFSKGQLQRGTA